MPFTSKRLPTNFYPRPPRGGRHGDARNGNPACRFLSTPSARRATGGRALEVLRRKFLSTPSARRATMKLFRHQVRGAFLSTPSARRATPSQSTLMASSANFYPRPPRGGRPKVVEPLDAPDKFLSTPSARRATCDMSVGEQAIKISIHALREEGDPVRKAAGLPTNLFLSTPSARRATLHGREQHHRRRDFYPRPPRGGRPKTAASSTNGNVFLSTPSARRATAKTETKSLFSNKLYNILHEFRRALIYNGSKSYPNHAK